MCLQIRQASVHDLDVLVPLFDGYRQFYLQPSDPALARAFLSERFAHHQSLILVACEDRGEGLGFTQLYPLFSSVRAVRVYLLNDLFVAGHARRRGVARALLTASAEYARALGAADLLLSTAKDNQPAQALYQSLGWRRDEGFCDYRLTLG
ncbi:MAG TPA: GNAT family N-acetyltransferase [Dyella sp.]|uniref:GNAT family N-acetyltransferase n=1 Tax=Dyella sp. TaxID=1869338 RepID=UPI002C7F44D4|nr:GNAT family N-acetyltransferase [Dyella sp.]HTV85728.1 GNAT family N-acetyltransferase [Dyella sp.]